MKHKGIQLSYRHTMTDRVDLRGIGTLGEGTVKLVLSPFRKVPTIKWKNLLPLGANSFLL